MSNGPKAFFNQTDLKRANYSIFNRPKTRENYSIFRLESSRSEYTAPFLLQSRGTVCLVNLGGSENYHRMIRSDGHGLYAHAKLYFVGFLKAMFGLFLRWYMVFFITLSMYAIKTNLFIKCI